MRTNRLLLLLPAVLSLFLLTDIKAAEAQYGYGHGGGGYGYGQPPPRPQFGFRHRPHFYAGAELSGNGVINQKTDAATRAYLGPGGGGGGLFAGFRFGPFFSLEASWNITYHSVLDDYETYYGSYWSAFHLQTVELSAKIHIPTQSMVEPFIQAGIGWAFLGVSWDESYYRDYSESGSYIFASGVCFNLGGGLDFWLSPFISFGGRVLYKGARFGEPDYRTKTAGGSKYTNFTSIVHADLNVTLHF